MRSSVAEVGSGVAGARRPHSGDSAAPRDIVDTVLGFARTLRAAGVAASPDRVEAMLAAGDVAGATRAYSGPLLPRSVAPGVARVRSEVGESLRRAIMRSGSPDLMSTWTRSSWGADDYDMWQAQRAAIGSSSPLRPLVEGQIARLDREIGS